MSIEEKVITLIKETSANETVHLSDSLESDLGFDSLSLVMLIIDLEELFDIELDPDDMSADNLNSVQSVVNMIGKYLEGENSDEQKS